MIHFGEHICQAALRYSRALLMTTARRLRSRVTRKHALSNVEGSHARFCTGGGAITRPADQNLDRLLSSRSRYAP